MKLAARCADCGHIEGQPKPARAVTCSACNYQQPTPRVVDSLAGFFMLGAVLGLVTVLVVAVTAV